MAKRKKHKEPEISVNFTEEGLHSAFRFFGFTTNSQTADLVELVMDSIRLNLDDDAVYDRAEYIWKREYSDE